MSKDLRKPTAKSSDKTKNTPSTKLPNVRKPS